MPKRKAPTKISGLVGSDDEDLMHTTDNEGAPPQETRDEPPTKKRRGRPRTSNETATATKPSTQANKRESATTAAAPPAVEPKKSSRRGRPRGSSRTSETAESRARAAVTEEPLDEDTYEQENTDPLASNGVKTSRSTRATKPPATRRRGRAASTAKQLRTDGEFEYTPTSARQTASQEASHGDVEPSPRPRAAQRRKNEPEETHQDDNLAEEFVDESILPDDQPSARHVPSSIARNARVRLATIGNAQESSPRKRKSGIEPDQGGDPELRRRIGDLTKKHDTLESKYRNLREIGIVEANTNMEKLRKQCESITTASNELVASLKSELDAQRSLGQQSRGLQKQLKDRDAEMTRLTAQAEEAQAKLAASQSEIKALQTKLAAARNTAASLENTARAPGSAMKGGAANRANAAANAEAVQLAQTAQLKQELYSDLTGLIVLDVRPRESDHLYDCIQTGVNGTLHFKLAVPKISTTDYESAEFQYLPLLDANRDRDLVNILPDFLTVEITFSRQHASKFYTRVIDALTKRRSTSAQ
ncbi:Monopolin complex subunit Csm1/Pcs1 [Penicillium hispanicum]|uniref:Monopolin complex subunit Csm1/Pcs1 n=1 Tax=Penicillium hispanicum TaxID=1080232 RepID=UPI00254243DA|nr:Monopolin complex subunit Csm1/Pcs1 [Penicillium hispanicum]KAJ5580004.1 Monopolin complex subunit Csm1/Pcs1 [Penicillium hispanicum]